MQLLKFENYNCQPCKQVGDYLKDTEHIIINAFENPEIASKFKVRSLPTVILLDDYDVEIGRTIGFKPQEIDKLILQL